MKRILIMLSIQLCLFLSVQAQFKIPEYRDLGQVKSKMLLVPLQEEVTRTLMDLKSKPDQLKAYQDGVVRFNDLLKSTLDKYWKLGKGIEYLPQSKVNQMLKEGNTKYVVFQYEMREGTLDPLMFGKVYGNENYTTETRKMTKAAGFGVFRLQTAVRNSDPTTFYSVFIPVAYPSEADMIYAVKMMQNELNTAMKERTYKVNDFEATVAKNNKQLKKKTLLIDPTQMDPKTTIDDLKKNYPNDVQLVDYEKVNEAVKSEDTTYAFVMIVPDDDPVNKFSRASINTRLMHLILDANTMNVLGAMRPTRLDYGKIAEDISKKEIKDYTKK